MISKDFTEWDKDPSEITSVPLEYFPAELTESTKNLDSLYSFFNHFLDEPILVEILKCTNERFDSECNKLTLNELRGFFGLLLLFGVTKKHDIEVSEIWCVESVNHMDWASVCMSRNRFLQISRNISFDQLSSRNERSIQDPKFFKMRKIFDMFKANCKKGLKPGVNLCIDEQLYSYRGKCAFKQYIPSKPAKYGIKFWAVVDCNSGYLLYTNIYLG